MKRPRVLYTINRMDVGGSQTHLLQVLRLLDRDRFEPLLCCLSGEGSLLEEARQIGVPVLNGGMGAIKSVAGAAAVVRLAGLMRRERVDVAHNYLLRANVVGTVAARAVRVPVALASKRGCHERHGLELAGARLSNWLASRVTANSNAVRDFVHANEGCPLEKMVVIPSGIDTERFSPLPPADYKTRLGVPPGRRVVGTVTRMRVRKGVAEFLRAVARVREHLPEVCAVVAGDVILEEPLAALAGSLGLEGHLFLLGQRTDMPEVLSAFDCFALSSHGEGMSNAVLEAMAMRLPVVATDAGGTAEAIEHRRTGLLVPPRDPTALTDALVRILTGSADEAAAMGERARAAVIERFSARAMVRQMETLYDDLLGVRAPGSPPSA